MLQNGQFIDEKRADEFNLDLKVWTIELMLRMLCGREFQRRGPSTKEGLSPALSQVRWIIRLWLERRPLRPGLLRLTDCIMYCRGLFESASCMFTDILKVISCVVR